MKRRSNNVLGSTAEVGVCFMVHGFNNCGYKGVREAVLEFCEERRVSYFHIPDIYGSFII